MRASPYRFASRERLLLCRKNENTHYRGNNEKIRRGDAQVLTAEEMKKLIESSVKKSHLKSRCSYTGTFGAMCSSGALVNLARRSPNQD
jgi:uncharacterized protein (DUF39 family)